MWERVFHLRYFFYVIFLSIFASGCQQIDSMIAESESTYLTNENFDTAIFAGGCFWCTESDFDKMPGVVSTISGYIGGTVVDPTYEQVVSGKTGHVEAVMVYFDKTKTNYSKLLNAYWFTIDPLTPNRQFCDSGAQYRSVIFYRNSEQKEQAEISRNMLDLSGRFTKPIVTEILPAVEFYRAEDYHQDYYQKNPLRYKYYRNNCGRDTRLKELWGTQH